MVDKRKMDILIQWTSQKGDIHPTVGDTYFETFKHIDFFCFKTYKLLCKVNAIEAFELNKILNKCCCEFIENGFINLHQGYHN